MITLDSWLHLAAHFSFHHIRPGQRWLPLLQKMPPPPHLFSSLSLTSPTDRTRTLQLHYLSRVWTTLNPTLLFYTIAAEIMVLDLSWGCDSDSSCFTLSGWPLQSEWPDEPLWPSSSRGRVESWFCVLTWEQNNKKQQRSLIGTWQHYDYNK